MKKQSISYSDLTKKQLQYLKEFYIQEKVNGMSNEELRNFVLEIISHQINDTIGKEEEMEAWKEMFNFYGDQFEIIVLEIQQKYPNHIKIHRNCLKPETKDILYFISTAHNYNIYEDINLLNG